MKKACPYGFGRTVSLDYEAAVERLVDDFQKKGFRIFSRVNLGEVLQNDLGIPCRRYTVISAARPELVYRAVSADCNMGLLFPCNIVVYEDSAGATLVMATDPARLVDMVRSPAAIEVGLELREELEGLLEAL